MKIKISVFRLDILLIITLIIPVIVQIGIIQHKTTKFFWLTPHRNVHANQFDTYSLATGSVNSKLETQGIVVPEEYLVGPGDVITVNVWGSVNYRYPQVITSDEKFLIPLVQLSSPDVPAAIIGGYISSSGLTLKELQEKVTQKLEQYYSGINISITLDQLRVFKVLVLGEVNKPGSYPARAVDRVSDAIRAAGDFTYYAARHRVEITHMNQQKSVVDQFLLLSKADITQDPYLRDGDIIFVPPLEAIVTIKGAVYGLTYSYSLPMDNVTNIETGGISEFIYELRDGETVKDLIEKAGGVTPWADLSHAYIERIHDNGEDSLQIIPVDLTEILIEKNLQNNILLENGDILVIPVLQSNVYVTGAVAKPGGYIFQPNRTVGDYVGLAGGPNENGSQSGWTIITPAGKKIAVDCMSPVERGDTIIVPTQFSARVREILLQLSTAATLAIYIITLTK